LFGTGVIQTAPSDDTFGVAVKTWNSSHGPLNIVKHRMLEAGVPGSGVGFGGIGYALDMTNVAWRPLQDTKLNPGVQSNGDDNYKDEYLTEATLEFALPALHGRLIGVTG
jgi:hypothetical protein